MYKIASILIVDDDADMRRVLRRILATAGYEVFEAADGFEAISAYRDHPVNLVITDMYMPGSDGLDVILRLRSEFPKARFIAISGGGFADKEHVLEAATAAGAVSTLPKPFAVEALLRTLSDCVTPVLEEADVH